MSKILIAIVLLSAALPSARADSLSDALYAVEVRGVHYFNAGDVATCRSEYHAALEVAGPKLPPDLQAVVADALAREQGEPTDEDAAFLLRATIDKVRKGLKAPIIHLDATPLKTTCLCQQGGQCLCLQAGLACHCNSAHSHVFTSARYRWSIHGDWAELIDAGTGKQVGGLMFDTGHFFPYVDGVWGAACEPPIAAPAKPQVSVAAPMPVMTMRSVRGCASGT